MPPKANRLKDSESPYLKQHAYNPVDWYPWGEEALKKAKREDKPILLSIGYSSCHWCHVMAHESFENGKVAAIMNKYFINIKLDREERPDIDQIYMDAVQTMGLRGGWPLNVFLTPDQKPFYGGTYFPTENWKKLLESIHEAFTTKRDKIEESANQFTKSLSFDEIEKYNLSENITSLSNETFKKGREKLKLNFDLQWGGFQKAPKFPMPSVWSFLLQDAFYSEEQSEAEHIFFTLDKIAQGGIYDHVGGGFSRYSVDSEWHIPHFEKMLYDNGQLLELYSDAYKVTGKQQYLDLIYQSIDWLELEMMDSSGGFYSALDADSEGKEGKFYVWTYDEIAEIAGAHLPMIADYYDISERGNWEGVNVLRTLESQVDVANRFEVEVEELRTVIKSFQKKALQKRNERVRPGLDNKIISGWNGLMLSGLLKAYQVTGDLNHKELIHKNALFLKNLITENQLLRLYKGETKGFLEDYAAVLRAFVNYYQTFGDESYLLLADQLCQTVIRSFSAPDSPLFFYTSKDSEELLVRKKEVFDNVIPSSNSMMADNLLTLGIMLDNREFKERAEKMIEQMSSLISEEPEYMSNWNLAAQKAVNPTAEVLIIGSNSEEYTKELNAYYLPNKVVMQTVNESSLVLFEHKETVGGKTTIYVCYDKTCKRPVFSVKDALAQMTE